MKLRAAIPGLFAVTLLCGATRVESAGNAPEPISLTLSAEKLAASPSAPTFDFQKVELNRASGGLYTLTLFPREAGVEIPPLDLKLLIPRTPRFANGSKSLSKIALIQREFNRNEVHSSLAGGLDFSIANNCLKEGLWEVKLARTVEGKAVPAFHAWLDFPKVEYARLFQEVNGTPLSESEPYLAAYPKMNGLPVPLAELRQVVSESKIPLTSRYPNEALQALPEQQGKKKFILTPDVTTYGGFSDPAHQPIQMAKFAEPGRYDPNDPMRCELTWLAHPTGMTSRVVRPVHGGAPFTEIEIAFANGYRILFADSQMSALPARVEPPSAESDVLKIVSGIGTPMIHATALERARELAEDRPRYLFLLDSDGKLVDNHLAGMDGLYLWRERGAPDLLHIWVVGYERIAFVAHFSTPWKL